VLRAPPISFFSIWLPEQCLVSGLDQCTPRYVVLSTPCYLVPLRHKYSPRHPKNDVTLVTCWAVFMLPTDMHMSFSLAFVRNCSNGIALNPLKN
jgi:hypothetical protein